MSVPESIERMRSLRDQIRENLKTFDHHQFTSNYGPEKEFSIKGIIAGVEAILVDISTLTRHHKKFIINVVIK